MKVSRTKLIEAVKFIPGKGNIFVPNAPVANPTVRATGINPVVSSARRRTRPGQPSQNQPIDFSSLPPPGTITGNPAASISKLVRDRMANAAERVRLQRAGFSREQAAVIAGPRPGEPKPAEPPLRQLNTPSTLTRPSAPPVNATRAEKEAFEIATKKYKDARRAQIYRSITTSPELRPGLEKLARTKETVKMLGRIGDITNQVVTPLINIASFVKDTIHRGNPEMEDESPGILGAANRVFSSRTDISTGLPTSEPSAATAIMQRLAGSRFRRTALKYGRTDYTPREPIVGVNTRPLLSQP